MKANLRSRNIAVNAYLGMLVVTITGALATFFILHVAYDAPLTTVFAVAAQLPN